MAGPYRLGIVGLGRIAWLLEQDPLRGKPCTHLGAWTEREDVVLVAACDTDPERLEAFARAYPGVPLYRDHEAMLTRESLDLVSICAYATARCEMVVAAAEAGVRGIWCEKAMATSLAEADRMAVVLKAHGTAMTVAFMRRWAPPYYAVKTLLEDGAIGKLESINVHFTSNMLHTGTHAFDLLRLWCREVETVQAWLHTDSADAAQSGYRFNRQTPVTDLGGFALLSLGNGARATIHAADKAYFRFEFELLGSEGLIRIGNTQRELWQAAGSAHFTGFRELEQVPFPEVPATSCWRAAADNLVAAMEGRAVPQCTVADGRQALAIALAMHVSQREGHRPVRLDELPDTLAVPSR